jgi:hypothetical protein
MLAVSIVFLGWGPQALGAHIPSTGPLPGNCVEFQANALGTLSPPNYPDVDITLDDWNDLHEVDFTISGLATNQYVDISVKSGTTVQEAGPYGNGSHSFDNNLQQEISHIRLCVFIQTTTTTTQPTTTTTQPTTTTTQGTTTTTQGTTTTTQGTTTTTEATTTTTEATTTSTDPSTTTTTVASTTSTVPDEVLPTVVTTSTTVPDEVEDTVVSSTLPFTGIETESLGQLALSLAALGALLLAISRRGSKDDGVDEIG